MRAVHKIAIAGVLMASGATAEPLAVPTCAFDNFAPEETQYNSYWSAEYGGTFVDYILSRADERPEQRIIENCKSGERLAIRYVGDESGDPALDRVLDDALSSETGYSLQQLGAMATQAGGAVQLGRAGYQSCACVELLERQ